MHTIRFGLRAAFLVAGLAVLTRSEAQGLAIRGIDPQLKSALGNLAEARPVIVGRCTYADYLLANGDFAATGTSVMSFTFPGNTIRPGMQIRAVLGGNYRNNTGVTKRVGAFARLTGVNGVTQTLGFQATVASNAAGLAAAWRSEIVIAASIAGVQGQYIPTIQQGAITKNKTYTTNLSPNSAIAFTEFSSTSVTDTNYASGQDVGGVILNATPNGSGISGNIFQQVYDATQSITVDIILPLGGIAPTEMTISSGYMEAL
jgi:hypothetical protein